MIKTRLVIFSSCIYLVSGLYPYFGKCRKDIYEKRVTNLDVSMFTNRCTDLSFIYITKNDDDIYCISERATQSNLIDISLFQFVYDNYHPQDDKNAFPRLITVDGIFENSTLTASQHIYDEKGRRQTVVYSLYVLYVSPAGVVLIYRCSPDGESDSDDVGIIATDVTLGAPFEEGIKGALQAYNDLNFTGCLQKLNVCPAVVTMNNVHNKTTNPGK